MARKRTAKRDRRARGAAPRAEAGSGPRWRPSRPGRWAVAGIAVTLLLAAARYDPWLFTGGDNVQYYALAKALVEGRGYVDLVAPGAAPHVLYPPGFPLLLVPFYLASGGSIAALGLASLLSAGVALWAAWHLARRDAAIPAWAAAAVPWTMGAYHAFHLYAHRVLSDMPFLALATGALAAVQPAAGEAAPSRRRWILGCALALGAFYVRVAGFTLLAALVAWALARRQWGRAAGAAAAFAAGVLPWMIWVRTAPQETAYVRTLATSSPFGGEETAAASFAARLAKTAVEYGTFQLPQLFWPADPPVAAARVLGCAIGLALLAYGAARVARGGLAPWHVYLVLTLGMLPFWPWLGDRYVLSLLPLLWLLILAGLDGASRRATGGPALAAGIVAAFVLASLVAGIAAAARQWDRTAAWLQGRDLAGYETFWADYFDGARWIGRNAPEDAVVMARKPTLAWYWSGRHAVEVRGRRGPVDARWEMIGATGATHLLLEPWTENAMAEALEVREAELPILYRAPGGMVVVVGLPDGPAPGADARRGP